MYERFIISTDHKGNKFPSRKKMCDYWKVSYEAFQKRIKNGWTLEQALTLPPDSKINGPCKTITDHKGKVYHTHKEMCEKYHISPQLFAKRIARGWSIERALTESNIRSKKKRGS